MPTPEQGIPKVKGIGDIKSLLLNPATTSHFYVRIAMPSGMTQYLSDNRISFDSETLSLMCCEATLPGSNMATLEVNNDFHGVTERYAYRRVYDDRIDLTFYVDAQNYMPIRVFEVWMKYIAQESADTPQEDRSTAEDPISRKKGTTSRDYSYFYRFNYPNNYISNDMTITKFEKSSPLRTIDPAISLLSTGGGFLSYSFVRVYPISIASMPVSYDSSQLLKCTVSMSYIRYVLDTADPIESAPPAASLSSATPAQQAQYNSTLENLSGTGALATSGSSLTVGGVSQSAANASGNTVSGFTVGSNSNVG